MAVKDLKSAYKTIMDDHFPEDMEISFGKGDEKQTLLYKKNTWIIDDVEKGLRYGENPGQEAALYKLVNGNLVLGDVQCIQPGQYLASDVELLQSGKHPGKTNITDADNALNILRYFTDQPIVSIMKHNNPCGVAIGDNMLDAYLKANKADQVAAFGGAIALNRTVDKATAEAITKGYSEVVVAPGFEEGVMDIFATRKNLRVMEIGNMQKLKSWIGERYIDFKSLMDGGLIAQMSYAPNATTLKDIKDLTLGHSSYKSKWYSIDRTPTEQEYKDMWFGWLVESGITSNSVIYVKDGVTVGIGTGEQDRVGVAKIARDKAYTKLKDILCRERIGEPYNVVESILLKGGGIEGKFSPIILKSKIGAINDKVNELKGGLIGSIMVSDAFFPFRDGVDVGIREGITAIIQPGGSERDYQSIKACNEANPKVTIVYTEQRSFKH